MTSPSLPAALLIRLGVLCGTMIVASPTITTGQSFPFVIPGDDGAASVTSRATLLGGPIEGSKFVTVRDGHFYRSDQRIRFWGVNLCFGACFPTHDEADRLAPHLAKLGINAVRFHHMDMQDAPSGIWAPVSDDGVRNLDREMVDRLDYFLAQLHANGIYANLNLHVSRTLSPAEGFPPAPPDLPWWAASNKWVMYYDRDVQAELKRYCRQLLLHKNPYRDNAARVDDVGIGLVEMLNENYFSKQGYALYKRLPPRFQKSLVIRWNEWLVRKYGDQAAMVRSWQREQPPLGAAILDAASWERRLGSWTINEPADGLPRELGVPGPNDDKAIRLVPRRVTDQDHDQQLAYRGLAAEKNQPLTLSFWVRSDRPRPYRVEFTTTSGGRWRDLGLFETLQSIGQWQHVRRMILPTETSSDASLVFTIGGDATPIEFSAVSIRKGAEASPLPRHQSLAGKTIGIPEAGWPLAAHRDMRQFMVDTEVAWVKELKTFLRDLGVRVPITASQVNYHDHRVHDEVSDFVDLHNYWHHPLFPSGDDWSPDRWTVGNDPMEADPTRLDWPQNSLLMRTGWRVDGKPMTLSEWNYPEPSFYSAGCIPMAAMLASLQDWDGVFFFDYDAFSRSDGESPFFRDYAANFFSFNGQPVKLALLGQCANLFLRGDLKPLEQSMTSRPDAPIDGRYALSHRLAVASEADAIEPTEFPDAAHLVSPDKQVEWKSVPPDSGFIRLNTRATRGVWGTIAGSQHALGAITVTAGEIAPNYGVVLISSVDGATLEEADRAILVVASHSENVDMGWNRDRTSVGRQWGSGPTQVTTCDVNLRFATTRDLRCFALDGKGQRRSEVRVTRQSGHATIEVGPQDKTLWYELEFSSL